MPVRGRGDSASLRDADRPGGDGGDGRHWRHGDQVSGDGWLDRLAVLPLPAWRVSVGIFLAGWILDCVQVTIIFIVIEVARRPDPGFILTTWLLALCTLAFAGAIGLAAATLTDNAGEAMLFLAVILAP